MQQGEIILALEAAIRGGSLSILCDGEEIAFRIGATDVSGSESLLAVVDEILNATDIDASSINKIAVSNGPGSYTGIRVGLATSFGLARALNIECFGSSAISAVANAFPDLDHFSVALPIGKEDVCWQSFERRPDGLAATSPARSESLQAFFSYLEVTTEQACVLHSDLFEQMESISTSNVRFVDAGKNMAFFVGRSAAAQDEISDLKPLYVQNTRFKP